LPSGLYSPDPKIRRREPGTLLLKQKSAGNLSSDLQDIYALLIAPTGGESLKTPLLPPSANRLMRMAKLSLAGDGVLPGSVTEIR
jgi:hypothetical protein